MEALHAESTSTLPVTGVSADADAESCWQRAAWIGHLSADDALRSYTSLLIALLHGEDAVSRWLLRYARAAGIQVDEIYAARKFTPAMLREIRERQAKGEVPSDKTGWTVSAGHIVEQAAELARVTGGAQLGIRHLIGAYLFEVPSAHAEQVKAWHIEPPREASALIRRIRESHPQEADAWVKHYATAFGGLPDLAGRDPLPAPRVSGFAADTPDGEDQLDIEDDVYALSALICSTRIEPPLSIGLFGDWGSGKSFFIRQMQKGVSWISGKARDSGRMQKELPFYKHVAQIEFNAWNYSGGNLWASLVQHILENLKLSPEDGDDVVGKRRERLQQEMDLERQANKAATAAAEDARKRLGAANAELNEKRAEHVRKVDDLKDLVARDVLREVVLDEATLRDMNELRTQLGLSEVGASIAEAVSTLEGARAVLQRGSAAFDLVPPGKRTRFLLGSAAVLLGPMVVAVAVEALARAVAPHVTSIAAFTGWLSTTLTAGAAWLRQRARFVGAQVAKVERLQAVVRQRVEAEEQRHEADVARLESQIALVREEFVAAQARRQAAVSRVERIEAQIAATTPASVLADFVRERSESSDYRKYLGLPAVIRRDFESISRMIAAENARLAKMTTVAEEEPNFDRRINRIVLYIDDLDRCPEALVVDVLKAVHLLLAFPLFVVVVAVDARWVSRSLANRFPGLLAPMKDGAWSGGVSALEGNASPTDYLEKIFQIPFWLREPSEVAVRSMLASLMRESQEVGPRPAPAHAGEPGHDDGHPSTGAAPVFKGRTHDPDAKALDIQPQESQYIARLAPLLERSPRSLKRFVNVYRLLKASLPPEEQDGFLDEDGPLGAPFKTVLMLLAAENGLPALSEALLNALLACRAPPTQTARTLGHLVDQLSSERPDRAGDIAHFTSWLDREAPGWKTADPSRFLAWVPRVARHSYQLHRSMGR